MYNHSKKNISEKVIVEPTETQDGQALSLHATKGFRKTRISSNEKFSNVTAAKRLIDRIASGNEI